MGDLDDLSLKASIGKLQKVPSGHCRMGSRFHPREHPPRTISVIEFDMAHAPVTVSQYAVFLQSGEYAQERWWGKDGLSWLHSEREGWGRQDRSHPEAWEIQHRHLFRPVVGVTFYEAEAYCSWLSFHKKTVVRLPTEEEWEYAARGDDGRPFPWGEEFNASYTNTFESGRFDAVDATTIKEDASPFGIMDMAGNVEQWTSSHYTPQENEVFSSSDLRIARGGSFEDTIYGARCSYRHAYPPGYFYPFLGFRLVVSHR